ncbi:MotA/TolQ/ExbB proton channel family protein [Limnohabitans sp. Rim47]|uniref:MotA/TolQ/ExbB proton channel family protein n=1 Tax=Limnohabitans sp. Rim47 TaxID=1100721 RepID=UPI000379AC42|nr:MotA/TolQ/ExbB proton channel family protein [Limnohabitans sp. Rim47]
MSHVLKKSLMGAALLISLALSSHSLAAPANEAPPAPVTAQATANPVAQVAPLAPDATATAATAATAEGNPYGLGALWVQGDAVAKGTLLILVLMSMGSWYVIFSKFTAQAKMQQFAKAAQADFWNSGSVRQATDALDPASPFRFIAEKGLEGASKHGGLLGAVDLNTWVTMSIQRAMGTVQSRLQDGLAVLATVGSTAPFVGLFGTVWGIYHALVKIGMSGQASIDKVAGPVGEALIMTAIGLAVAVPAVLGYNWLVRRNKAVMEEVNAFGADLHAVLLASAPK